MALQGAGGECRPGPSLETLLGREALELTWEGELEGGGSLQVWSSSLGRDDWWAAVLTTPEGESCIAAQGQRHGFGRSAQ